MKNLAKILIISIIATVIGCKKVPSDVIAPDDMAALMADIHTAEAVVEMNHASYNNDSLKLTMRQSVYMRHGVNSAQVDSSIAWYGRNIKYYMEVYDKTIEILEHRLIETGNRIHSRRLGGRMAKRTLHINQRPPALAHDYIQFRPRPQLGER